VPRGASGLTGGERGEKEDRIRSASQPRGVSFSKTGKGQECASKENGAGERINQKARAPVFRKSFEMGWVTAWQMGGKGEKGAMVGKRGRKGNESTALGEGCERRKSRLVGRKN